MTPKIHPHWWLAPFALLLFAAGIGGYSLWPADEPRFGEVAREMFDSGEYLVPRINGETYLEKPPLLFWAMALFALPLGDVTETAARLPSVLSGLIALLLAYALAARIFGTRVALWTAVILVTSHRFWWQARTAQIDMLLTACMMIALYALWRWDERRDRRWLCILWAATAAGMLAKGPPALVFPLLGLWFFYRPEPHARRATHWLLGTLAACAAAALWFVPARLAGAATAAQALDAGMGDNLFRNTVGRFFLGVSKAEPPWHYLLTIPVDLLPWTLFLPVALVWTWRRRHDHRGMRLLLAWTLPALVFFSLSIGKRAIYILPLFPVFAILLAAALCDLMDRAPAETLRRHTRAWRALWALIVLAGAAAWPVIQATPYADLAPMVLVAACVLPLIALPAFLPWPAAPWRVPHVLAGQTAALFLLIALWVLPGIEPHKGARDFCAPIRELAGAGHDFRLYSVGFSREEYVYYARRHHTPAFMGLVPMDGVDGIDPAALARQQIRARKLIMDAVENVPVADLARPTPEERAALRAAIDQAVENSGPHAGALRLFEDALRAAVDAFDAEFRAPGPAFMFVQDQDWRWLVALHTEPPGHAILRHEPVGRREVLLFANPAGARLAGLAP